MEDTRKKWEGDRKNRFLMINLVASSAELGLTVATFLYLGLQVLSGSPLL